jgi:FKBP-type peptidyl-prolyl cis-trans isomerase
MRRASALIAIPLLAALAVVGCGSSGTTSSASAANASVTATGSFGKVPKVTIPAEKASTNLVTKTLIKGSGAKVTTSDSFVGNYVAYTWSGTKHTLATSTYSSTPALFTGSLLTGLAAALKNVTVGSRVMAVIPPKDGFGSSGDSELGISGSDTLIFVIDVVQEIGNTQGATGSKVSSGGGSLPTVSDAATNPTITIPKNTTAPKTLETKTLIQGTGATVASGNYVVVQYTGVNWRTGKTFDSSWSRSEPYGTVLSSQDIITGWVDGLTGQKVGSRVLLVVPPKDGYGTSGDSNAGIKGTDDLVFVIDIVAVYTTTAS